jgi:hypothetical protein
VCFCHMLICLWQSFSAFVSSVYSGECLFVWLSFYVISPFLSSKLNGVLFFFESLQRRLDRIESSVAQVYDLDSLRYSCLVLTLKMVSKAEEISRQGQVHPTVHRGNGGFTTFTLRIGKSIFKERGWRWSKLGGVASWGVVQVPWVLVPWWVLCLRMVSRAPVRVLKSSPVMTTHEK